MQISADRDNAFDSSTIRVLVVDDSAYARKMMSHMLSLNPGITVAGTARSGIEALEKVETLAPDVITLDLYMPEMNGIEFIREQMQRRGLPIVLISSADNNATEVLTALELGAVDFLQKPTALANDKLLDISHDLVKKIKMAATVPAGKIGVSESRLANRTPNVGVDLSPKTAFKVLVIGVSTGGPQALKHLIPQLSASFPLPIAVVMHMPIGYTALYAERLNAISALTVKEAVDGDELRQGEVLLAQAGRHLKLQQRSTSKQVIARLDLQPRDTLHRPAVDELFKSAADVFGEQVLGVVMTGMGSDGLLGAACIKAQGGTVLTEAEESCIVYGMPRSVVEAGLSDTQATLACMAQTIENSL